MYADLHVHSWRSDGTQSPEEIVCAARQGGVGLLAVADHELIEGSRETGPLCRAAGIGFLRAVELECRNESECYHVLAYNPDFDDAAFVALVRANRRRLDAMSERLIERMQTDYPQVSPQDFNAFVHDPALGGWKCLEYLMKRGVTGSLREAMPLYTRYDVTYGGAGFPEMREVIDCIHAAGGRAVLAHPGEVIVGGEKARLSGATPAFRQRLDRLIALGLDGLECYYPTHPAAIRDACLAACEARGLMVTAGSDCHGGFGRARVGEMNIPVGWLKLNGLSVL